MDPFEMKDEQLELAATLQTLVLKDFERLLKDGTASPTDRATVVRLLSANGWTVDPSMLPKGLRDKLTEKVDPLDFEDEEDN